jgi:hypothetical protein
MSGRRNLGKPGTKKGATSRCAPPSSSAAADTGAARGDELGSSEARRVVFPVLLEFGVSSYPLYPGKEGAGLAFPVAPGVSIIAGINGLGKTTLLQILFRVLSGPVDWKKRKAGEVAGSSNIDLGAWRDPGYFKNRVPNAGKGASATALIGFGEARVQVTRSLESLAISELTLNGVKQEATRDRYQAIVCELSGLAR